MTRPAAPTAPAERGGLNERLLVELLLGNAPMVMLYAEGYTDEEVTRAKVTSSLSTTSAAVSIGPVTARET